MADTQHQLATIEPVYRRVAIMRTYSEAVSDFYAPVRRSLDECGFRLGEETSATSAVPQLHLIRRIWPITEGGAPRSPTPLFSYAYFQRGADVGAIKKTLFEGGKLSQGFEAYIRWVESTDATLAVRNAREYFDRVATEPEEIEPEELRHHLLMLFARTPVTGGIPGTLLRLAREEGEGGRTMLGAPLDDKGMARIPIVLVETLGSSDGGLPDLKVWTAGFSRDGWQLRRRSERQDRVDGLDVSGEHSAGEEFFLGHIDKWFRGGRGAGKGRAGWRLLWIPLFDFHRQGEMAGAFLGWAFQFLGWRQPLNGTGSDLTDYAAKQVLDYAQACLRPVGLISRSLYEESMREILSRDLEVEKPAEVLCRSVQLLEGWASADTPDTLCGDGADDDQRVFAWSSRSGSPMLTIKLGATRYDDERLWGPPTSLQIRLYPRLQEFRLPDALAQDEECSANIAARIREIYRQLSLTALQIERKRAVEAQTTRADLAATFAHSFSKVGEAISKGLPSSCAAEILDDVMRTINEAAIADEVRRPIQAKLKQDTAGIRSDPATRLYQEYFFPQVRSFYDKIQLMERLRGRTLRPKVEEAFSLKGEVEELFRATVIPVARHLELDRINETLPLFAQPEGVLDTSDLGGLFLVPGSIEGDPDRAGKVNHALRDLWRNFFIEFFLNALKGRAWFLLPNPVNERIRISWKPLNERVARVTMRNPVEPPDAPVGEEREDEIKRPSAEYGLSGWGRFGMRLTLTDILGAGKLRFFRTRHDRDFGLGECRIDLEKPWWEDRR